MNMCFFCVQVMKAMCKQGYKDALHFLKKNGKKQWFTHQTFSKSCDDLFVYLIRFRHFGIL